MSRGWWLRTQSQTPATHLLLDGGRLAVPDDHAGAFLNVYFNALLRGERLCVVELKTPSFRLFLDIDARVSQTTDTIDHFHTAFSTICNAAGEFWVLDDPLIRCLVSAADIKTHDDGSLKRGFHIIFPEIIVNAPIALAFRDVLVAKLEAVCPGICLNPWSDIIDPCVFKANGLRAIYSCKGPNEDRAYAPILSVAQGTIQPVDNTNVQERRVFVHECSIRVFGSTLTPCRGGQDSIADQPHVHSAGGVVVGRSVALDVYADVLPKVHAVLPVVYQHQRFMGVFKTEHAVMLRSSSRYCQNVDREHRTSTVYFNVTRKGVCQKCYCRKDDHGCATYSSPIYTLDEETLQAFFPLEPKELPVIPKLPSKKRGKSLDDLLGQSRFVKKKPVKRKK